MKGKIGLEEHFALRETLGDSLPFVPPNFAGELETRLLDIHDMRIRLMDKHGMEMMLLSFNAPAVQAIPDVAKANDLARRANDYLAEQIVKQPGRFQGLAALPLQDCDLATRELQRCVKDLGFKGSLVNGFSNAGDMQTCLYYDLPQYRPFWAECEKLDVPFYLHPRNPVPSWSQIYKGAEWLLGPTWAFGQETAVHSLRLMGSGLFDEHPNLKIVIGHMGEGLPFSMWRVDNRNAWVSAKNHKSKNPIGYYFQKNFWITTSGNFRTQALLNTMMEVGADRILFSTDWPFENVDHACDWFDSATISEEDRYKIGRSNASKLFKLGLD